MKAETFTFVGGYADGKRMKVARRSNGDLPPGVYIAEPAGPFVCDPEAVAVIDKGYKTHLYKHATINGGGRYVSFYLYHSIPVADAVVALVREYLGQ